MSLQESFLGQPSLSQVFTWQIELQSVFQVFSVLTSPPCSPSVCCSCFCQGLGLLFEQLTFSYSPRKALGLEMVGCCLPLIFPGRTQN